MRSNSHKRISLTNDDIPVSAADLQANQPVEKAEPREVAVQEPQRRAEQHPRVTGPPAGGMPGLRSLHGVASQFLKILVVGPISEVLEPGPQPSGTARCDRDLGVVALAHVAARIAAEQSQHLIRAPAAVANAVPRK